MAKKTDVFEYPVQVLMSDQTVKATKVAGWTKAKRACIRACVVGGAVGAQLEHREKSKAVRVWTDGRGVLRLAFGDSKKIDSTLRVDGRVYAKGNSSLVRTAANMLGYHKPELDIDLS